MQAREAALALLWRRFFHLSAGRSQHEAMYVAAVGIETAPVWLARLWQVKQNCVLFYCNETMGRGNFNNVWNGVVINAPAKKK
ncbi:hypothetical protein D0895_14430 [Serratia ureilytica]|uniref:hypothetical protein n=1 Tax=Serratia ureilytica TaxID=300181 RepID=UPI00164E735F|nr:hypothetical protein [Serratia ureilytica]QNK98669.1 hypothetical protein D0895_14430 [Serratia ureilytica]